MPALDNVDQDKPQLQKLILKFMNVTHFGEKSNYTMVKPQFLTLSYKLKIHIKTMSKTLSDFKKFNYIRCAVYRCIRHSNNAEKRHFIYRLSS